MPVTWRRTRDGSDGLVAAGVSSVDEVLEEMGVVFCARRAGSEGEAEEDEVIGGGDDAGLRGATIFGAVHAEVGDGRRLGEAEGDLEFVPRAGLGLDGGGVVEVGEVGSAVEDDPGGVAEGFSIVVGGRLDGGGHKRSLHGGSTREGSGS